VLEGISCQVNPITLLLCQGQLVTTIYSPFNIILDTGSHCQILSSVIIMRALYAKYNYPPGVLCGQALLIWMLISEKTCVTPHKVDRSFYSVELYQEIWCNALYAGLSKGIWTEKKSFWHDIIFINANTSNSF